MATAHERDRAELVRTLQSEGETGELQARCDASGVTIDEVRACARVDAKGRPLNQLQDGERLVTHADKHLACGCTAQRCDCRELHVDPGGSAPAGEEHTDADEGNLEGGLFTFGSDDTNYAKALIWLGAERIGELRVECEAEEQARRKAAPGSPTSGTYNRILAESIGRALPDLAEQAEHESTAWLQAQFRALPLPASPEPTAKESRTDMAQRDEVDAARARGNAAARDAWRQPLGGKHDAPSGVRSDADDAPLDADAARDAMNRRAATAWAEALGGESNLTDAERNTRTDAAERRYAEAQARTDAHRTDIATDDTPAPTPEEEEQVRARQRMNRRAANAWREPLNKADEEQLRLARLARETDD